MPSSDLLGDLPLAALATNTFAFAAADDAYQALVGGGQGVIHVALGYG